MHTFALIRRHTVLPAAARCVLISLRNADETRTKNTRTLGHQKNATRRIATRGICSDHKKSQQQQPTGGPEKKGRRVPRNGRLKRINKSWLAHVPL